MKIIVFHRIQPNFNDSVGSSKDYKKVAAFYLWNLTSKGALEYAFRITNTIDQPWVLNKGNGGGTRTPAKYIRR
jgi:hypothetical protein